MQLQFSPSEEDSIVHTLYASMYRGSGPTPVQSKTAGHSAVSGMQKSIASLSAFTQTFLDKTS